MTSWTYIEKPGDALTIVDHASNFVPAGLDLGIDEATRQTHIAWDIGAANLADALGFSVFKATISRLVIDMNREHDADGLVPLESDGVPIPGNLGDHRARIAGYWQPYHDELAHVISRLRPRLLVSLHSFTPARATVPDDLRPWEIGILYNTDDRAARIALAALRARSVVVGDQEPYSGKTLNATMNRHGEATGTPYLGIEVRQDLIALPSGVARWASILQPVIATCLDHFNDRGAGDR